MQGLGWRDYVLIKYDYAQDKRWIQNLVDTGKAFPPDKQRPRVFEQFLWTSLLRTGLRLAILNYHRTPDISP